MGCIYSKKRKEALRKNKTVVAQPRQKYLPENTGHSDNDANGLVTNCPEFTERQKELVLESWKVVKEDMDQVGIQMFMK